MTQIDLCLTYLKNILQFDQLNKFASTLQDSITASPTLRNYVLNLWRATKAPTDFGVKVSGVDMNRLVLSGASPRGMAMVLKAARVNAWLNDRNLQCCQKIFMMYFTQLWRIVWSLVQCMKCAAPKSS